MTLNKPIDNVENAMEVAQNRQIWCDRIQD